jgi:hypothetical protein
VSVIGLGRISSQTRRTLAAIGEDASQAHLKAPAGCPRRLDLTDASWIFWPSGYSVIFCPLQPTTVTPTSLCSQTNLKLLIKVTRVSRVIDGPAAPDPWPCAAPARYLVQCKVKPLSASSKRLFDLVCLSTWKFSPPLVELEEFFCHNKASSAAPSTLVVSMQNILAPAQSSRLAQSMAAIAEPRYFASIAISSSIDWPSDDLQDTFFCGSHQVTSRLLATSFRPHLLV